MHFKKVILIITGKDEITVPYITKHLDQMNQSYFRVDIDSFVMSGGCITLTFLDNTIDGTIAYEGDKKLDLDTVKSVWFRRPQKVIVENVQDSVERQFIEDEFSASLWSLYTCLDEKEIFWMNHPLYARDLLEHNKMLQMKFARESGLLIPKTIITNEPQKLIEFCEEKGGFIAVKAVRSRIFQNPEGGAIGIYTNRVSTDYLKAHIKAIARAPIMAQEYVAKKLELRVTVVGNQIFTCAIHSQDSERTKNDWRRYDFDKVKHESWTLPKEIETKIFTFMNRCHLSFGAIDMILTPNDEYVFLEVNPSGQYIWIENLTNFSISRAIAETLAIV
ncbi:MAG: hypothetical protein NUV47_00055 [Patescibacteria group bacterium]|nr:hypothetical protein [Patescibacteria group bacterium]